MDHLGEGAQHSSGTRRHRASTFSSPATPRINSDKIDSSSDPGHGSSASSSAGPQIVSIEHLRPVTLGSTTSRNEAGLSYVGTSATQSFVSMDSQSGPTDTPHLSVHILPESDDDEIGGDTPAAGNPNSGPPIDSGDDTVRQSVSVALRSPPDHVVETSDDHPPAIQQPHTTDSHNIRTTLPVIDIPAEVIRPNNSPVIPIQKPLAIDSEAIPTTTAVTDASIRAVELSNYLASPSQKLSATRVRNIPPPATGTSTQEPPITYESIYSQKVETPTPPTPRAIISQPTVPSKQDQKPLRSARQDSARNVRTRPSNAIPPSTINPTSPTDPQESTTNSQQPLSKASIPLPPPKTEPDPSSGNGFFSTQAQHPPFPPSTDQIETQYVNMLLALDGIPQIHNIMASFFTWILLAGFVLFPGTFTSLQEANGEGLGRVGGAILGSISHLPLQVIFVFAWICTGVGAIGMAYLWYRWHANYIWVVNRIFMPGLLNSLAGVISALANILGVHHATFSLTSKSTIIVTTGLAGICGGLTLFYQFFLIRNVKKKHDEEMGKHRAGKHGEGIVDLSKRKVARRLG